MKTTLYGMLAFAVMLPTAAQARDYLADGLNAAKGKSITSIIDVIGAPDRAEEIAGSKVYYWEPGTVADAIPCKIKVTVDKTETVRSASYNGSIFACDGFKDSFKRAIKSKAL